MRTLLEIHDIHRFPESFGITFHVLSGPIWIIQIEKTRKKLKHINAATFFNYSYKNSQYINSPKTVAENLKTLILCSMNPGCSKNSLTN